MSNIRQYFGDAVEAIAKARNPAARRKRDYNTMDRGAGPELVKWDTALLGPEPDDAEIAAAEGQMDSHEQTMGADRQHLKENAPTGQLQQRIVRIERVLGLSDH